MTCPFCQKEMKKGHIKTKGANVLFFMPKDQRYGIFPTKKRVEKRGGVVLDGPYLTRFYETSIASCQCDACRKIVISY